MSDDAPLDPSALRDLAAAVQTPVVRPGDDGYDEARRIWNARVQGRPSAVVRCRTTEEVARTIDVVREWELPFTVRSGGHDYAGKSSVDGAVQIDLSSMDGVRVDAERRRVVVGPGATWGDVDRATQPHGLAAAGCTVSTVGVAGYTLHGGTGYLARRHGLSLDNLVRAQVVTAQGERVRASEEENADLFWALRGAGSNFGVATSFELALHPVGPEVLGGQLVYRHEDAAEVLAVWREVMAGAPEELMCYPFFLRIPPAPVFPEEHHGNVAIDLVFAWTGGVEAGHEAVEPLRGIADPILDWVEPQEYLAVQQAFDAGMPKGLRWQSRAGYLDEVSDDVVELLCRRTAEMRGPFTAAYLEPLTGTAGRVGSEETAFPHRGGVHGYHVLGGWQDPADDDEVMAWTRAFHDELDDHAHGGVYVNLLGEDEEERVPEAFGPNWDRLVEIKAAWDPDNLFRGNHNIPPSR